MYLCLDSVGRDREGWDSVVGQYRLSECCFTSTETVGLLGTATSTFTQLFSSAVQVTYSLAIGFQQVFLPPKCDYLLVTCGLPAGVFTPPECDDLLVTSGVSTAVSVTTCCETFDNYGTTD